MFSSRVMTEPDFYESVEAGLEELEGKIAYVVHYPKLLDNVIVRQGECYRAFIQPDRSIGSYKVVLQQIPKKRIEKIRAATDADEITLEKAVQEAFSNGVIEVKLTLPLEVQSEEREYQNDNTLRHRLSRLSNRIFLRSLRENGHYSF
jgi:hypothetical protein